MLKKHEKTFGGKILRTAKVNTNALFKQEVVTHSDFMQGRAGNCGLIASLASISQRPEFLTQIAPEIYHTNDGVKLRFNMFFEGESIKVTIDDALPFFKTTYFDQLKSSRYFPSFLASVLQKLKLFNENILLIYARSARKNNLYLSSFFEKVFVKQACNKSYERSIYTRKVFALSSFSDCMIGYWFLNKKASKHKFMNCIKFEVDHKSSLVLGISPLLNEDSQKEIVGYGHGHAYVVIDYNYNCKAIKLYDPRCNPKRCISNEKLSPPVTMSADPNKGELWVSMDELENRSVDLAFLYSKNFYKSVFQVKHKINKSAFDRNNFIAINCLKVSVKEKSMFMINFFSYSHALSRFKFYVTTVDDQKQRIKLKYQLPERFYPNSLKPWLNKGEAKTEYFQRFVLQPDTYVFSLRLQLSKEDLNEKQVNFLLKVGSVSECKFEVIKS